MKIHRYKTFQVIDLIWFIYFLMSYTLGNVIKYNHYITTLMLVFMTIYSHMSSPMFRIKKKERSIIFYYGLFSLWIALSWFWAKKPSDEQETIVISCVEIILMLLCLIDYVNNSKDNLRKIMHIYVNATVTFGLIYYAISPITSWGTERMGGFTPIWRNAAGYYFTFAAAFAFYLYMLKKQNKEHVKKPWEILLLLFMAVATGSRKVFIHIALIILLYIILQKEITKKVKYFIAALLLIGIAFGIGCQIPTFQNMYANRLIDIFMGAESGDGSTIVRSYMRVFAFTLFLESPLVGNGLNAFMSWMAANTAFRARWNIPAMYSHCNQAELLCNSGIIGFLLYYLYPFVIVCKGMKQYHKPYVRMGISIIIAYLILDYGTISYYMRFYIFILCIGIMCIKVETK